MLCTHRVSKRLRKLEHLTFPKDTSEQPQEPAGFLLELNIVNTGHSFSSVVSKVPSLSAHIGALTEVLLGAMMSRLKKDCQ